jgi:ribosomal protein S6
MSEGEVRDQTERRLYEAAYLVDPGIAEGKAREAVLPLKDALVRVGGSVMAEEVPTLRNLAYSIKKHSNAYFGCLRFETDGATALRAKQILAMIPEIIRFLVVRVEVSAPPRPTRSSHSAVSVPVPMGERVEKPVLSEEELDRRIEEMVGKG